MKTTVTTNVKRRSFLKSAAVSTMAASSVTMAGNAVADSPPKAPAKTNQGYKLTSHIKEYYRVARF